MFQRVASLPGVASIALLTAFAGQPSRDPTWSITLQKEVKWVQLAPTGHVIASTDEGLMGINAETGQVMWKNEDLKSLGEDRFEFIPLTQYAAVTKSSGPLGAHARLVVFDYVEGVEKWNSEKLDILSSMGQFIVPSKRALLVYGRNTKGAEWMRMVRLDDGELIWENKDFFKGRAPAIFPVGRTKSTLIGNQDPEFDTDETFIEAMNGKAIRKWNLADGQMVWERELKALEGRAPAPSYGYAPLVLDRDKGVVYVPAVKGMYAVRTSDGSLVWGEKPAELKGIPTGLQVVPEGVLVMGGADHEGKGGEPFLMLLDDATGAARWKKPFDKLKDATMFRVKDGNAYLWSDKRLYRIALAGGAATEVAKDIEFGGGETPSSIRLTDAGVLLLRSAQNVMGLELDGTVQFHSYHKAPGSSLIAKVASTALVAAVNVGTTMAAHQRAMSNAYQSGTGRGSASYSLITSNPYLSKRFTATATADTYTYILTEVQAEDGKGPGLVKVNRMTGKTENQIVLGDKEPLYTVDEVESRLFFVKGKKEIQCFAF